MFSIPSWAGEFPFSKNGADATIASNTTIADAAGFKKYGTLTINSGITLRVARTPFILFVNELVFGDTASTLSADGPDGAASDDTYWDNFSRGGLAGVTQRAQGGAGGGLLIIYAGRISGAAGVISANGGAGYGAGIVDAASSEAGGHGAFSVHDSGAESEKWAGILEGGSRAEGNLNPLVRLLAHGGGSVDTVYGTGGGNGGSTTGEGGGGSGIGGGGGAGSGSAVGGSATSVSPAGILTLVSHGCFGGGGGAAVTSNAFAIWNSGSGGGGGGLLVVTGDAAVTPDLQANGGTKAGDLGFDGGDGVTHLVEIDPGYTFLGKSTGGSSTTVVLPSHASSVDDFYNSLAAEIVGGTGAGQRQRITDYDGSTKTATVAGWGTAPDSTSVVQLT